jgi:hypothetical protein
VVLSQKRVLLHLTEQPVPVCFACASRSAVPARPEILAPATEELLDSYRSRALVLNWSETTCPGPIDMYALLRCLKAVRTPPALDLGKSCFQTLQSDLSLFRLPFRTLAEWQEFKVDLLTRKVRARTCRRGSIAFEFVRDPRQGGATGAKRYELPSIFPHSLSRL